MGLGHEDRSYAVENNVPVNNGADNLWFKVTFKEGPCVGSFKFTYGSDDAAKKQNCIDNFMPILDKVQSPHFTVHVGLLIPSQV
jgi:hypothetical protein